MIDSVSLPQHTVAVYETHQEVAAAIKILKDCGHDIKNLTVVGQEYESEEHPVGFINTGDRMLAWGKFGIFWGSIWGLLFGSAMLFIPGLGYVMFGGWIVAVLEGALMGGGLAALGGALASIGVPRDSIVKYESELKVGRFLLIVHGSEAEVQRAKTELGSTTPTSIDTFSAREPALR